MKIERRADQPIGETEALAATGRSLTEWFELLDARGGPALGRRDIGQWLYAQKVDPWWAATLNCEYEAARSVLDKDGRARGYTVCSTKAIKADPQRCFELFASAVALDRWLGPGHGSGFEEGKVLVNADGNRASVKKVVPGKTIRCTWEDEGLSLPTPVEIKFAPTAGKTTVMVTIDRLQTRAEADGYRRAWGQALERQKALVEAA